MSSWGDEDGHVDCLRDVLSGGGRALMNTCGGIAEFVASVRVICLGLRWRGPGGDFVYYCYSFSYGRDRQNRYPSSFKYVRLLT